MRWTTAGVSTVECLIAITVFGVGALGAAGTLTLGIRTSASGTHLGATTRIAAEVLDSLRFQFRDRQHACLLLTPGRRTGPGGEVVDWSVVPAALGARLVVRLSYLAPTGQHYDSIAGFLPCR